MAKCSARLNTRQETCLEIKKDDKKGCNLLDRQYVEMMLIARNKKQLTINTLQHNYTYLPQTVVD